MKIMTFNIRCDTGMTVPGEADYWPQRAVLVEKMLREYKPDILGVQELMDHQIPSVLAGLGPGYNWVGNARDDTQACSERNPIFYNKDVVDFVRTKTYALSDTPDKLGSVSWNNKDPRILTCVDFQEKVSRKLFTVVNTHLDHISEASRLKSADLIRRTFFWCENVIIMGDFNDVSGSGVYNTLTRNYLDSYIATEKWTNFGGTFNNYKEPSSSDLRLDWILSSGFTVKEIETVKYNEHGKYPSDHLPVVAEMKLKG